jgi:hypothetical protein
MTDTREVSRDEAGAILKGATIASAESAERMTVGEGVVALATAVNDAAASPGSSGRGVGLEPPEPSVTVAEPYLTLRRKPCAVWSVVSFI